MAVGHLLCAVRLSSPGPKTVCTHAVLGGLKDGFSASFSERLSCPEAPLVGADPLGGGSHGQASEIADVGRTRGSVQSLDFGRGVRHEMSVRGKQAAFCLQQGASCRFGVAHDSRIGLVVVGPGDLAARLIMATPSVGDCVDAAIPRPRVRHGDPRGL